MKLDTLLNMLTAEQLQAISNNDDYKILNATNYAENCYEVIVQNVEGLELRGNIELEDNDGELELFWDDEFVNADDDE